MTINRASIILNYEVDVDIQFILGIADNIAKRIVLPEGQISLSFIDDEYMQKLNREYRSKDKTTDVLTFCLNDEDMLGDIYISTDAVRRNASENSLEYEKELSRVIAHSFAHLVGYDHKTDESYQIIRDFEDFLLKNETK